MKFCEKCNRNCYDFKQTHDFKYVCKDCYYSLHYCNGCGAVYFEGYDKVLKEEYGKVVLEELCDGCIVFTPEKPEIHSKKDIAGSWVYLCNSCNSYFPSKETILNVNRDLQCLECCLKDYQGSLSILETVKNNPWVIALIKKQTPEVCLAAVKQDGKLLKHVKEQTEDICIEAVKNNGLAILFVENHTEAICLEAVKQCSWVLKYVKIQTAEICLEAVRKDHTVINYVDIKYQYLFKK